MTAHQFKESRFIGCVVAISCLCMPLLNTSYAEANLTTIEDGALADSLVAYWSFNGNANDSSGNGHDGVVVGAALTADRKGAENQAYWFDGTNDYIWAANDGTLCPTSFTFSAWIRVDRVGQQSGALMGLQENYKGYGFACGKAWGNDVLAMVGDGGIWRGSFYTQTPGIWSFYALTLDANGTQSFYVNGQLVEPPLEDIHMVQTTANMIIGRHYAQTGTGWWFCGAIDEVRLYSRALSAEEVEALYTNNDDLVAHWAFDGNANDSSGNCHSGVVVGASLTTDRKGTENQAYWFDGTNDYIWAANDGTLCPTSFTFSAWIRVDRVGQQSGALMGLQENYKGYGLACGQAWGNDVLAMVGDGAIWRGSFYTQTPGIWSFYALTLDANGTQSFYVNGQLVEPPLEDIHMVQTTANMIIGRHYAQTGTGWWFCGAIDEVRLHSRALSAQEVNVLYGEEILAAPANVLATDGSYNDKVRVIWDSLINATGYEVWRATMNASGLASKLADTVASPYDDTSATAGTVYYYWVKARNATSVSSFSDSDSGYAQETIAAPSGVSASDGTYTDKVRVSWNSVSGATGYELWRGANSYSGVAYQIADVAETMCDDISAVAETTYYYWVKAKNALVTSAFSSPDTGYRAQESALLLPPADVTATTNLTDKVKVSWQGAAGATSYELYRNTANNSAMAVKVSDSVDTTYDDTGAAVDTANYYWIKSCNASGVSVFSSPAMGMRRSSTTDLTAPNEVDASDGTYTDKVVVAWTSVSGAAGYEVWRAWSNSTAVASQVGTTEATSYEDRTVLPNVRCYYWVKARNASGVSGFSAADVGYSASSGGAGLADLAITNFTFLPRKISMGDNPSTISMQLINKGPNSMSFPNTKVGFDFYLSKNASWGDGDDLWIGEHLADYTLAANNYTLALLSQSALAGITIPSDASGNYYVFARVSHALPSKLLDENGNDNVLMRSGPILVSTNVSRNAINDFDGDGVSDLAVYRDSDGLWFAMTASGTMILWGENWGSSELGTVSGDFDGDGRADLAVYHETAGSWYIRPVGGSPICWGANWGGQGFRPVRGDYDGDGKSDLAIYHQAGGYWFIRTAGGTIICWATYCGGPGFTAVPGDYNGDGQSDLAVYYEAAGTWYALTHAGSVLVWGLPWGGSGFAAVPGDYDGDGKSDHAVYCEAQGLWYVMSANGTPITFGTYCGGAGYKAAPGDYDGDGKSDLAVYEPVSGNWYILALMDGGGTSVIAWGMNWGGNGLVPVGIGW